MKYIRTKDNVIELNEKEQYIKGIHIYVSKKINERDYWFKDDDILKQADSIEDLCDGILVEEIGNESNRFIMETDELKKMSKEEIENHLTSWRFNLFIKNDRGLIYIAKLNDEGELELK